MTKRHKSKKYVQKYEIWKGKENYVKNLEVFTIDHFFLLLVTHFLIKTFKFQFLFTFLSFHLFIIYKGFKHKIIT